MAQALLRERFDAQLGAVVARLADRVRWIAVATLLVMLASVAVPLCAMPECTPTSLAAACSDFKPACSDCGPGPLIMKHSRDEAASAAAPAAASPVALEPAVIVPEPILVAFTVAEPAPTGAPPPLDPLGVRLTV